MNEKFENLKKKIFHRSKYRGVKELDIIFERYINKYSALIDEDDLNELNEFLDVPDSELLDFILNPSKVPSNLKNRTFYRLIQFEK